MNPSPIPNQISATQSRKKLRSHGWAGGNGLRGAARAAPSVKVEAVMAAPRMRWVRLGPRNAGHNCPVGTAAGPASAHHLDLVVAAVPDHVAVGGGQDDA